MLVGPAGSGKTTLVEALLAATGAINRMGRVEEGTTTPTTTRPRSASSGRSGCPSRRSSVRRHQDQPPRRPRVRRLRRRPARRACAPPTARCSSSPPARASTARPRRCGRSARAVGMPRCVVISKLNHAARRLRRACWRPPRTRSATRSSRCTCRCRTPAPRSTTSSRCSRRPSPTTPSYEPRAGRCASPTRTSSCSSTSNRGTLIEGIIEESEDESLMDRYMGGEDIDVDAARRRPRDRGRARLVLPRRPGLRPVRARPRRAARDHHLGVPAALRARLPRRSTRPPARPSTGLSCDPAGPLVAEVVKTTSDPYVGRISLARVFSGTVRPDATVHVSGHFTEFYGDRARPRGPRRGRARSARCRRRWARPSGSSTPCIAGDICAIAKLSRAETGDTLSDREQPLVMEPWSMPDPLLPIALVAHAKADEDKLGQALQRLAAEDPTVRIEHHAETLPARLWCMGEAHADVLLDRLRNRYGVQVDQVDVRVPLRETIAGHGQGEGPPRQAERRARAVRRVRHRGRAAGDAVAGSSSSTRSSAAPCRGSSSPASRRAYAPSSSKG